MGFNSAFKGLTTRLERY